ncbi:MAG: prephenate dehydrogenase/arogenate dehydrogenase family protein, partial [Rhodospirillaceae bacterium]
MSETSPQPMFGTVAFIGIGLIGASLALAMKRHGMAGRIVAASRRQETLDTALRLGIADDVSTDIGTVVKDADLVMVCTPVGACGEIARAIAPHLKPGAIVSDVGSVKGAVIRDMKAALPPSVAFVPGHPLAGTEFS